MSQPESEPTRSNRLQRRAAEAAARGKHPQGSWNPKSALDKTDQSDVEDQFRSGNSARGPPVFLLLKDVLDRTKIPRSTLFAMIATGDFPAPIRLTPRRIAFFESEVTAFQLSRIRTRGNMEAA